MVAWLQLRFRLSIDSPRSGSRAKWLTMGMKGEGEGLLIQYPLSFRRRDPFSWKAHGHQPPPLFNADFNAKKTTASPPLKTEESPLFLRVPCVYSHA